MFTGLIEAVGRLKSREARGGDWRIAVDTGNLAMQDVHLGDSIATQGICLTVVSFSGQAFCADVSLETARHSTLLDWHPGQLLNLEKAMQPSSRFGGHMVSGHVDGVGNIVSVTPEARSWQYRIRAPKELLRYIALKGSIAVDGISLTVNGLEADVFSLTLVPHTMSHTALELWRPGVRVNLEVDLVARYLERLMERTHPDSGGISSDFLSRHGYL